jgi:hypothetical protein
MLLSRCSWTGEASTGGSDVRRARHALAVIGLLGAACVRAQLVPACRFDDASAALVAETIGRAAQTYKELERPLPFDKVAVNPKALTSDAGTLAVYVVTDANVDGVRADGCASRPPAKDETLDKLSVRGGCVAVGQGRPELRCSSRAIGLFGRIGNKDGRANPALLYVLAHELGHIYQRQVGEYEGRAARIDLAQPRAAKLQSLKDSCEPTSTKREEEADALAVEVMKRLLPKPPYREPLFSERGSLLWSVDQLVLAANAWQQASLELEFISRPAVHKTFIPTEFPTPPATAAANARKFVCDVLRGTKGAVYHPLQSATHPSLDERMARVAEAMRPLAASLPNDTTRTQFESVARLQSQVSPILTHIYRETGAYMEAVHAAICTAVNAPTPPACP